MKHIHVISFQNPTPPNYGGVIDVYYKLKALHDEGWAITLHTYYYKGRDKTPPPFFTENDKVCFYHRETGLKTNLSMLPYIVNSRRDETLLANLLADESPILFEGLHTTYFLSHPALAGRVKVVRTHNVEHKYYSGLAAAEKSALPKAYYYIESLRLKKYERILVNADVIAAISEGDKLHFENKFPDKRVVLLPCFYDDTPPGSQPGSGDYVLYQGNLEVPENEAAALRICRDIAPRLASARFVIAGSNPGRILKETIAGTANVDLKANLPYTEFEKVLAYARVHLLVTEQATGVKLKLLNALRRGAHIVANSKMMSSTGLEAYVTVADTPEEICKAIEKKMEEPFLCGRRLPDCYDNLYNIRQLEGIINQQSKIKRPFHKF